MDSKDLITTFSIVAYDPDNDEWGVGVASKFLAVGSMVPWARAGVGAVATQAWGNPNYGPDGLDLLEQDKSPEETIKILTEADPRGEFRQLGIIDKEGNTASFTGDQCLDWAGSKEGKNYSVQGNILAGREVVDSMADTFENTKGKLADRLISALEAGQEAGGDIRGKQAAALFVVKENAGINGLDDRYIDLRVDDHQIPIKELKRLLQLFYEQRG